MVSDTTQSDFETRLEQVLMAALPFCQKLVTAERLSGGASQETYRLRIETPEGGQRQLALRRAPGGVVSEVAEGPPGLATEALLMQSARQAGVPEPEVFYVLKEADGLGDGFVMEWLEGEALGARINRSPTFDAIRPRLAYECGKILARIHAIDLSATGLDTRLSRMTPEQFIRQTWERYQGLDTPQPMIDYTARWLLDNQPEDHRMALVHNDFRNGNFLLQADGISAVLDWEVAHIGDPMRDLGWICTNSWRFGGEQPVGGFGTYEDLFRGYEEISGVAVDPSHVKFWEVFGSFWWAVGCLGMAEHYRSGPDQTVERPAIGRRSSECQVDCVNLLLPGTVQLVQSDERLSTLDMPRVDELLVSVRDFLREDLMAATEGRLNFLSRVASNSLDIVLRQWQLGAQARERERMALSDFYGKRTADSDLESMKWDLVRSLRDGTQSLADEKLKTYLRNAVVNQIAIDQPRYSGYIRAINETQS
ncbi:MAG: phosphotransferase family protein [Gammaproteobacteria bacterium]|nr:phosphotransferase family protein [Gammaproteobacteria bacterium]